MNITRPGGPLSTAMVRAAASFLVSKCGTANATVVNTYVNETLFINLNGTALVPKERRTTTAVLSLSADTSLPLDSGLNTTLLTCLNDTIGNNLPLVNVQHGLIDSQYAGIVAGTTVHGWYTSNFAALLCCPKTAEYLSSGVVFSLFSH
ncbi:hypothetical protein K439DRAFT_1634627 [Ramaria rubella]|nr:hypothetical protein K439DRAFT_1634627 [Ramaria rubella]